LFTVWLHFTVKFQQTDEAIAQADMSEEKSTINKKSTVTINAPG